MNTHWSSNIQTITDLETHRSLRFSDSTKEILLKKLGLDNSVSILDAGCGTGLLTRRLKKWLDTDKRIAGVDLDSSFIDFAKRKAGEEQLSNMEYLCTDVLSMPYPDNSFDICLSYTLIEHVPNVPFLLEMKRICRKDGRVITMTVFPETRRWQEPLSGEEKELWEILNTHYMKKLEKYNIGQYFSNPRDLLLTYGKLGFKHIAFDSLSITIAADEHGRSYEEKVKIIEMNRTGELERLAVCGNEGMDKKVIGKLREYINVRYTLRMEKLERGIKVWDYELSNLIIITGEP